MQSNVYMVLTIFAIIVNPENITWVLREKHVDHK